MHARVIFRVRFLVASANHKITRIGEKLLPVITDGKPVDVDVRDPQYLRHDTKKAIEEAGRSGILIYSMSLDPRVDHYVSRIFGERNYLVDGSCGAIAGIDKVGN